MSKLSDFYRIFGPKKPKGPPVCVSKKLRREIIERDGAVCFYCWRALEDAEITIDHAKPRSKGGSASPENLRVACKPCNSSKRDRTWPYPHICARQP